VCTYLCVCVCVCFFFPPRASLSFLCANAIPLGSFQQYVDGGMFAHDPASCALTYALSKRRLGIPLEDIVLLSLGTGHVNHYYADERNHK
jgi:patatin-like phospholipase/acyl hydrolase